MAESQGTAGERRPANAPTVLMFQPTEFEIVPPERMSEWEATLQEQVGLRLPEAEAMKSGVRCYSWCGEPIFDDCDEL